MAKLHYKESPTQKEKASFAKFLAEDEELILATGFGSAHLRSRFIIGLVVPGIIFWCLGGLMAYFMHVNVGIGILVGIGVAGIFGFFKTFLEYHAHRYLLTTRRVIIKKGFFAVQLTSALFDKITHIEVDQSFIDKVVYHHGTIVINTAGMNKGEITLTYVDYPIELKNLLERLINRERERFGIRTGSMEMVEGEIIE